MTDIDIRPCLEPDNRRRYVADGPIDFETWLEISFECGKTGMDTELVGGVIVDNMAAQYPHEWIFAWLFKVLGGYVELRKLGIVLGSRTAVRISDVNGRLPDILFVRDDNSQIIQDAAIFGAPDLVIEIVSDNDRPYNLVPLEADYRSIDVPEIVFIDPRKKRVRRINKIGDHYDEVYVTEGRLEFASVPGFWIEVEWLFADNKPPTLSVVKDLIDAQDE
jgi:Uma2 family endonuclease